MLESLVCFTHTRWEEDDSQRCVQLMTRFSRRLRVFCFEPPRFDLQSDAHAKLQATERGSLVHLVPRLPRNAPEWAARLLQEASIESVLTHAGVRAPLFWYDTPMAVPYTRRLLGLGLIYDCTRNWQLCREAHPAAGPLERELLTRADVVFAGNPGLFELRHPQHHTVRLFADADSAAAWDRTWQRMASLIDDTLVTRLADPPRIGLARQAVPARHH